MVTDIHDWSRMDSYQPHPIFSAQQTLQDSTQPSSDQDHQPHCRVCSYDHGGHMGQTLVAAAFVAASIPAQNVINSFHPDFWHSRSTPPKLRPPIA